MTIHHSVYSHSLEAQEESKSQLQSMVSTRDELSQSIAQKKKQLADMSNLLEDLRRDLATLSRDHEMAKADVSAVAAGRESSQLQVLTCNLNG